MSTDGLGPWESLRVPPSDPAAYADWYERLGTWRARARLAAGYTGPRYDQGAMAWTQSCFACGMVMLWDEALHRPEQAHLRLAHFLEGSRRRFGGLDAVVLWHAYPRIGFDERNQFDYYRQVPGGTGAIREMVQECRHMGVRAYLAYCPWDTGTRREPDGEVAALSELVATSGADGVFLDTLSEGSVEIVDRLGRRSGVALMTEGEVPLDKVADHPQSWAQWPPQGTVPHLLQAKWFEPRHMSYLVRRWHTDHSDELHLAWLNGAGVVVWENVFGSHNGWSEADAALLRQMRPVQRYLAPLFSQGRSRPLMPTGLPAVYASYWEGAALRVWTVANASRAAVEGPLMTVEVATGDELWDLGAGVAVGAAARPGPVVVEAALEAKGIRAYASGPSARIREIVSAVGAGPSALPRPRVVVPTSPSPVTGGWSVAGERPSSKAAAEGPAGPDRGDEVAHFLPSEVDLAVEYRLRECGLDGPAPLADAVAPHLHGTVRLVRRARLGGFSVDRGPVTTARFLDFVATTGYPWPASWAWEQAGRGGGPAAGRLAGADPVVFVCLEDALAFCSWAGKRLPTAEEWQYALESGEAGYGRRRVWEWTATEVLDGHTRASIVKGGSDFHAQGSEWYADGGERGPAWRAKFIRYWPAADRCSTVGFRCAW